ncbi:MAG TPA: ROK family protein [Chloroflexia bacterium]|nr:ROK family protein [Chloroflexia bacterium]
MPALRESNEPSPGVRLYAGLDIGGTKMAAGLVTAKGELALRLTVPTEASQGGAAVLERALELVEKLLQEAASQGLPAPTALGIAAGGRIDTERGVVAAASAMIPGWTGTPLVESFQARFGLPCQADNDVNAQALAESRFGAGRGYRQMLYAAAGTGLGGGLVLDGRLYRGGHYCAGEIGHSLYRAGGLACECGRQGCLEQYTATAAIQRYYRTASGAERILSIPELASQAEANPYGPAGRAFTEAGSALGTGLASLACLLDPQVIVLGGGLAAASPLYLEAARRGYRQQAWPELADLPLLPGLPGGLAGISGAAALVMEEVMEAPLC